MDESIKQMLETLKKSVTGIFEAAPEARGDLLEKSFSEFNEALEPELQKVFEGGAEELAKMAPAAFVEPLYKGLGTVGRVANLLGNMAGQVQAIKDGKDQYGPPSNGGDPELDPCGEDVAEMLDHAVSFATLALRSAVNDHVDPVAEDEDMDDADFNYMQVPNAGDPDHDLIVKSVLPEDLLKFCTDPAAIDMAVVQLGAGLMIEGGVAEETLQKVFQIEQDDVLAKDAGMGMQADPSAGAGTDPGDGSADPNDPIAQLEILGRIQAAGLMQLEHIMQLFEGGGGGGDPTAVDPNADPAAGGAADPTAVDPNADPAAGGDAGAAAPADPAAGGDAGGEDPTKKKGKEPPQFAKLDGGVLDDELAKRDSEIDALRKQLGEVSETLPAAMELIKRLSAQPAPPKGVLQAPPLSKSEDAGGAAAADGDVLTKLAKEWHAAKTDAAKHQVLLKAQFKGIKGVTQELLEKAL